MQTFIIRLLQQSLWGGIATLAVLALTALLRRAHVPSRLLCWLWLAVAVRFSVVGSLKVVLPRPQTPALANTADALHGFSMPAAPQLAPAAAPTQAVFSLWQAALLVWSLGVVLLGLRAVYGYLRLRRTVATACRGVDGCYTGSCVPAPMTLGILHPAIYLPQELTGTARAAVLAHERAHIHRHDPLFKPLYYMVACLHWFNPLAWLAFSQFERTLESACDESAAAACSKADRAAYCAVILQFAAKGHAAPGSLAFGQGQVRARIAHLLQYRKPRALALVTAIAAVGLCATACMVNPTTAEPLQTPAPTTAAAVVASPTPAQTAAPEAPAAQSTSVVFVSALPATLPELSGYFSSPIASYDYVSRFMGSAHKGDDLAADEGTPVYAAADGYVQAADYHDSYGYYVVLYHGDIENTGSVQTLYAHLQSTAATAGTAVKRGDLIGYVGSTGASTGSHLHFELCINGAVMPPRYFTAYPGNDALAADKADWEALQKQADGGGAAAAYHDLVAA